MIEKSAARLSQNLDEVRSSCRPTGEGPIGRDQGRAEALRGREVEAIRQGLLQFQCELRRGLDVVCVRQQKYLTIRQGRNQARSVFSRSAPLSS